jgi:hypothetical protein
MMIGYDIYDRFTMEHFPLCQIIILTISFFFARKSTQLGIYKILIFSIKCFNEKWNNRIATFSTAIGLVFSNFWRILCCFIYVFHCILIKFNFFSKILSNKSILSFNSKKIGFLMMPHLTHVLIKKNQVGFLFWKLMDFLFVFNLISSF